MRVSCLDEQFREVDSGDGVLGREAESLLKMCAGARGSSAEDGGEMSFEACEDAQGTGGVIGGINLSSVPERAAGLKGQERRAKESRELGQQRSINAEPEVSFDALRFESNGLKAEGQGALMSGPRLVSACGFLAQKKERAAQSPENFVVERGGRCIQQPQAGAHVLFIITRKVERVRAFYYL
jgi:hypothetical protein